MSLLLMRRGAGTIVVSQSITLLADDATVSVTQGSSVGITLTLSRTNFTGAVSLAVSGLPTGVTGSFSDSTLTGAETTSTLTLTASGSASVVTGDAFTIDATGTGVSSSVAGTVDVVAAPSGDPTPSGTILIDTRAGGNADIQAQTTWAGAWAAFKSACRGGYSELIGGTDMTAAGGVNEGALTSSATGAYQTQAGNGLSGWNFTTDVDGAGTRAFRHDFIGYGDRPATSFTKSTALLDYTRDIRPNIPLVSGSAPTEMYVQWKWRGGRTATGGGYDDPSNWSGTNRPSEVGRFALCNEEVTQNNGSSKWLLVPRAGVGGGGCSRYDIIWAGSTTTETTGTGTVDVVATTGNAGTATSSTSQSSLIGKLLRIEPASSWALYEVTAGSGTSWTVTTRFDPNGTVGTHTGASFSIMSKRSAPARVNGNYTGVECTGDPTVPSSPIAWNQTGAFDITAAVNTDVTFTAYLKASSTNAATDGIVRLWANGEMISERTDVNHAAFGFDRLQILNIMQKPRFTQTEYIWDIVVWAP